MLTLLNALDLKLNSTTYFCLVLLVALNWSFLKYLNSSLI